MRPETLHDRCSFWLGVHSRTLRRAIFALPIQSRVRRELGARLLGIAYTRFNRTGQFPMRAFAPDGEFIQAAEFPDTAGTFRGHEGIEAALRELFEGFQRMRFYPQTVFVPSRDRLLLLVRASITSGGLELDRTVGHLLEFDRGFVTRMTTIYEEAEALEAVGLSE